MRRLGFWFLCLFSLLGVPHVRAAEPTATAVVEKLHDGLLAAMKAGSKGFEARRGILDPIVRATYDLPAMARVSSGAAWAKMSADERTQVAEAFAAWTVATYASQFKSFDGERFVTRGEKDGSSGRKAVETQIVVKGEAPTVLIYQLRADAGPWKIVDVYLDGTVSQLALRRSDFAAVLGKGGASALVAQMKTLTAQLAKGG